MRYTDIEVGQQVIYNFNRQQSRRYDPKDGKLAVVVAKGVEHRYEVTEGGWDYRRTYKTSRQGVRIKVLAYKHRGYSVTDPPIMDAPESEQTTLAAHLQPATAEAVALFREGQKALMERVATEAADDQQEKLWMKRFAMAGFEVKIDHKGLVIDRDDIERLLERLEAE